MSRRVSVKFRGREVANPLARKLIVIFLLIWMPIALLIGMVVLIISVPLALILDQPLKALGLYGTIHPGELKLDRSSFRKVK